MQVLEMNSFVRLVALTLGVMSPAMVRSQPPVRVRLIELKNPTDKSRGLRADMESEKLRAFAKRYTAAWCSQNAASVASFFAVNGSLKINDGAPAVGRAAITASAQGFMSAFPDMIVKMDGLEVHGRHATYHWTLIGTNTGPNGTGKSVRISGYEEWTIGKNGLIAKSLGHFDEAEYHRQLNS